MVFHLTANQCWRATKRTSWGSRCYWQQWRCTLGPTGFVQEHMWSGDYILPVWHTGEPNRTLLLLMWFFLNRVCAYSSTQSWKHVNNFWLVLIYLCLTSSHIVDRNGTTMDIACIVAGSGQTIYDFVRYATDWSKLADMRLTLAPRHSAA